MASERNATDHAHSTRVAAGARPSLLTAHVAGNAALKGGVVLSRAYSQSNMDKTISYLARSAQTPFRVLFCAAHS